MLALRVVAGDITKYCGMMTDPYHLWIGMGVNSEVKTATFMFVRRHSPVLDSRFTTVASVHMEGNHMAPDFSNNGFKETIRRVFRPIPVDPESLDIERNEERKIYFFRVMMGREYKTVTLSQSFCRVPNMSGEYCGSTQRDSVKATLVGRIDAKEAKGALKYTVRPHEFQMEETPFFLIGG